MALRTLPSDTPTRSPRLLAPRSRTRLVVFLLLAGAAASIAAGSMTTQSGVAAHSSAAVHSGAAVRSVERSNSAADDPASRPAAPGGPTDPHEVSDFVERFIAEAALLP